MQHPLPPKKDSFLAWLVVLSAALFFCYEFIQMNMFDAINGELMRSFNLNATQISDLSSAFFWADMLFVFPAGLLLDRFSTRLVLLIMMGSCVVGTFLFAGAQSFGFALATHFFVGIGDAFGFLCALILASRWFHTDRQALVTGVIVTFAMVGGVVAHTPVAYLVAQMGWRHAMIVNGFLGIALWVLMWLLVQDKPKHAVLNHNEMIKNHPFLPGLWQALCNFQNWAAGLYTGLTNLPLMVVGGVWGNTFLREVHHFDTASATTISSMLFMGTIFGSPFFGKLSDKIKNRRGPMLIGAAVSLILSVYMIYGHYDNFWLAATLFFALGFSTSCQILGYPIITASNPAHLTGTALGLSASLIMASAALCQQFFGAWLDKLSHGQMVDGVAFYSAKMFQTSMLIFPVTLAASVLLVLWIKEPKHEKKNDLATTHLDSLAIGE
jgi:sugar phosphate permease